MGRRSAPAPARRPAPKAAAPAPARQAPAPARQAPPPAAAPVQQQAPLAPAGGGGGMLSGLAGTMMSGMAFGTGSAIAHQAVGAVTRSMSGSDKEAAPQAAAPVQQAAAPAQNMCDMDQTAFNQCLQQNPNNFQACDSYMSALQACQSAARDNGF